GRWDARMLYDLFPGSTGAEPTDLKWTDDNHVTFAATIPGKGRELVSLSMDSVDRKVSVYQHNIQPEPGSRDPMTELLP
ncbi:MAG: hypothetical protein WC655_21925, partial [Candidatus Hydrogenedentales bacterium]